MSESTDHFDLCIIGSGSGLSLIDDDISDWKIALIDNGTGVTNAFGGTCLNAGCIPTKMLAVPAKYAAMVSKAAQVNVDLRCEGIDFAALSDRIFSRTDSISASGLAGLEQRENVEVIFGDARLLDEHTVRVPGRSITADRIVLAAGSRPRALHRPGFDDPYLHGFVHDSGSIMRVDQIPTRLVIIGAGIEAVEFAHIFSALGTEVAIIARGEKLIRHHDGDISDRMTELLSQRIWLRTNQEVTELEANPSGGVIVMSKDSYGMEYSYTTDSVLIATGRIPNGDQLQVEKAGITLDERGFIPVDEYGRTCVPHIWALGDICSHQMLKHVANAQARTVKANLLAERDGRPLQQNPAGSVAPFGIFGDPEIAGVGATEQQLIEDGVDYVSWQQDFASVAYGWALGDHKEYFVKLLADRDSGKLLGAHIIGDQAPTLIQPLVTAMRFDIPLADFARGQYWVHPALTEVVENAVLGLLGKLNS